MNDVKVMINKEIENLKDEIVNTTLKLIKIRSVEDTPAPNMPFGKGINDALLVCENLCKSLDLKQKTMMDMRLRRSMGIRMRMCVL